MTSYKVPKGTIDAARTLLAGTGNIDQVYEIVLRSHDGNEDEAEARKVYFVPIGPVIGIAIVRGTSRPVDEDFIFVSASAFGNVLPALGFRFVGRSYPAVVLEDPA